MADDDLPPSLRASSDVPPSLRSQDQIPPSLRNKQSIGQTMIESLKQVANPIPGIEEAANKPLPVLTQFKQGVTSALDKIATKITPSPEDIESKAAQTGKVPYTQIVENVAAHTGAKFLGGMIPNTPMDLAMLYGTGEAIKMNAGMGEIPKEMPAPNLPKGADMSVDALREGVAKETVQRLQPVEPKTPEAMQIDKDTSVSTPLKQMGVPEALADSSPRLRGTEIAPAMKPEIVPGTDAFSMQVLNRLMVPAADAVAKQGQFGQLLANDMRFVNDAPPVRYGMEFGSEFEKMHNAIPELMREKAGNALSDALEGKNQDVIPSQMVDFVKQNLAKIADEAEALGIKVVRPNGEIVPFAPRENYYPRIMKPEILEEIIAGKNGRLSEIAKHLQETKQINKNNFSAAFEQVKLFRKNLIDRKFGNLERSRELDLPPQFYERNAFKVIPFYMRTAMQRLAEVRVFGLNDVKAMDHIYNIARDGMDADLALRTYRRFTGRDPIDQVAKGMFQGLRNLATGSMIQFQTTLYHLPRTLYPALEAGYFRAGKALINSFGEASEAESRKFGVNLSHAMSEYLGQEYGGGRSLPGKFTQLTLKIEGITALDRFDRKFAAILGRDWIENDIVPKFLKKPNDVRYRGALARLGISPETVLQNKGMSEMEMNVAAKRFSDRTQGAPGPLSLPLWWTSPTGKMYAQFKNFTYTVSREMGGAIWNAAKTGDLETLARIGTGLPAAGLAVYGMRKTIGMKDTQYSRNHTLNTVLNVLRDAIPMPIGLDIVFKILQGRKGVQDLMMPPSIEQLSDIVGDIGQSVRTHHVSKAVRKDLARHIPLVGTYVSHHVR